MRLEPLYLLVFLALYGNVISRTLERPVYNKESLVLIDKRQKATIPSYNINFPRADIPPLVHPEPDPAPIPHSDGEGNGDDNISVGHGPGDISGSESGDRPTGLTTDSEEILERIDLIIEEDGTTTSEKYQNCEDFVYYSGFSDLTPVETFQSTYFGGKDSMTYHEFYPEDKLDPPGTIQSYLMDDIEESALYKIWTLTSLRYAQATKGTVWFIVPKDADILDPYKDPSKGVWRWFEAGPLTGSDSKVTKIIRVNMEDLRPDLDNPIWKAGDPPLEVPPLNLDYDSVKLQKSLETSKL